jgi:CubicO group peptidase (beta-lactamase class C family)
MMNRSLITKSILTGLAAATVACGSGANTTGAPGDSTANKPSPIQTRITSRAQASPATSRQAKYAHAQSALRAKPKSTAAPAGVPDKYRAFAAAFDLDAQIGAAPGAAVALIEHGKVSFTHAYGVTSPGGTTNVDADTIFRVGTLTQPLTALAELSLIDKGKGTLGQAVASAIPNLALSGDGASALTIGQLLSNQSGLYDFTQLSYDPTLATYSCDTSPGSLASFVTGQVFGQNEFLASPPGAVYTQSNPAFILAGAAIEQQTGAYFPDAMKSTLFAPLGMSRTFLVPGDAVAAGNTADGSMYGPGGSIASVGVADYDCAAYRPYGFALSSVSDYAKVAALLASGNTSVLSEKSRRAMESSQIDNRDVGKNNGSGYGVTVSRGYITQDNLYYPTKTISAVSMMGGYSATMYVLPDTGFGFVALSNFQGATFLRSLDVAVRAFGGVPDASPIPCDDFAAPEKLASYAGTYNDPTGQVGRIVITAQDGALTADFPDADAYGIQFWPQMSPTLRDGFLLPIYGYPNTVTFMPDGKGGYPYLLLDDLVPAARVAPDGGI